MKKTIKGLLYGISCLMIGIIIGQATNYAVATVKRFKTIPERIEYIEKRQKGMTLKQIYKQVKKNTADIEELKRQG